MIEREQIEMDVVFVGAGPANLAAALHLKSEIKKHDELVEIFLFEELQILESEVRQPSLRNLFLLDRFGHFY